MEQSVEDEASAGPGAFRFSHLLDAADASRRLAHLSKPPDEISASAQTSQHLPPSMQLAAPEGASAPPLLTELDASEEVSSACLLDLQFLA